MAGILVENTGATLLDHNSVTLSTGWGILFDDVSSDNVYGRNFLGRNGAGSPTCTGTSVGTDLCDEGANNQSYGNNLASSAGGLF